MTENSSTRIALTTFSRMSLRRYASTNVDEILSKVDRSTCTFIHVVHTSVTLSSRILEHFGLPASLAEQIEGAAAAELDTSSERYLFKRFHFIEEAVAGRVARTPATAGVLIRGAETDRFTEAGASLVVGEDYVLLFEIADASPLLARAVEAVLQRERQLRERGIEYLLYRLAKTILIDNYFDLMQRLLERLQELEAPLLDGSTDTTIYRELTRFRRALHPFERSLSHVAEFSREVARERPAFQGGLSYVSMNLGDDCEWLEREFSMLRDRTSELIGTYRDNVGAQLNNVMRSLTVISVMFLPLSFIAGFYGMNFPNMPAFRWSGGFPTAITLMLAILVGSLLYARRKKWL
jgi:magnesium transporter